MSPLPEEMPDRAEESILFHVKQSKTAPKKQPMEDKTMAVTFLTKDNFKSEVMQADKPVLIDFYADWCGPCQMVSPIVDEISGERSDVKVCKVNVDEQVELAQAFGVSSIPTLAVISGGKLVNHAVGAQPKSAILDMLDAATK